MTRYIPGRFDLPRANMMWVWPPPYGSMEPRPTQKTPLRIGDAERDRAIAALGDHFAEGRLNAEEFDQRVDQAIKARFNDDLEPLFVDLPRTPEPNTEPGSNRRPDAHSRMVTRDLVRTAHCDLRPGRSRHPQRTVVGVDVPLGVPDHRFLPAPPALLRTNTPPLPLLISACGQPQAGSAELATIRI